MEITDKDVADFQDLYKAEFHKVIDAQTARHKLTLLVRQVELTYSPVTTEQIEELARRDVMQEDALALAELIYDIYQDKKNLK